MLEASKYTRTTLLPLDNSKLTATRKVYTVSRLNQEVQNLLEKGFGTLWLQGELSNFSRPSSGHFYFTLKDSKAQIRCAMFKGRNRYVEFDPGNGDAVLVRGKLGLYATRGDFQLIVEHMEPAGAGRLQAAFEATKGRLDAEGWFDVANKLPLPPLPQTIGVVTSPTSAALRDVLQVLARRCKQSNIIIYPAQTQGAAAAPSLVKAIGTATQRNEADVILVVRGGGSIEDLWAFNEVAVAQAIRECAIPIVAGIGHEVDVTISDLVADMRAPTPSAAAELATPDVSSLEQRLGTATHRLAQSTKGRLRALGIGFSQTNERLHLRDPARTVREQMQRLDEITTRLNRTSKLSADARTRALDQLSSRLQAQSPDITVRQQRVSLQALEHRMEVAVTTGHKQAQSRFNLLARALHGVSPLAVLDRGYALIKSNDRVLMDAASVQAGDEISARLANGEIVAVVSATKALNSTK